MAQFPAYYRLNAPCNAPSHTFNNPDNQHTPTPTQTQKALTDKVFTTRRSADSWKLCRRRFLSASFVNGALTLQQTEKNSKSIHHFPPQIHNAFMLGRFFYFFSRYIFKRMPCLSTMPCFSTINFAAEADSCLLVNTDQAP